MMWKLPFRLAIAAAACAFFLPSAAIAQAGDSSVDDGTVVAEAKPAAVLFQDLEPLQLTLKAPFKPLHRSKTKRSAEHNAVLSYTDASGARLDIPLKVRSRGHWRLKNCVIPPLRLNFAKVATAGTPFEGLDKNRLVMHCRDNDEFDQYVLREYQLYRVWNQLTDLSHRARVARVTYVDEATDQPITTRYAFILEEDSEMAERNGGRLLKAQGAKVGDLDTYQDALVGLFQYMVGNVDWSVAGLHNVLLVQKGVNVYATVYDFDFTGTVRTRYSVPDYRLPISSVRQRLFRGYCATPEDYAQVFAWFNDRKPAIYALYSEEDPVGRLIDRKYAQETLAYFEEFYKIINDRGLARDRIIRACLQSQ
jgi:hypothetical protein